MGLRRRINQQRGQSRRAHRTRSGYRIFFSACAPSFAVSSDVGASIRQQHRNRRAAAAFHRAGKLSYPHRVVRQVRWREPAAYMAQALAGQAMSNDDEVARAQLPFEFMLNALRLKEGFALADFTARTGLPLSAIQKPLAEAERRGLVARDFQQVWPTARGFDFLSDLQALFLPD